MDFFFPSSPICFLLPNASAFLQFSAEEAGLDSCCVSPWLCLGEPQVMPRDTGSYKPGAVLSTL